MKPHCSSHQVSLRGENKYSFCQKTSVLFQAGYYTKWIIIWGPMSLKKERENDQELGCFWYASGIFINVVVNLQGIDDTRDKFGLIYFG